MIDSLPRNTEELMAWSWPQMEPHFKALAARELTPATVDEWLADWSTLAAHVSEIYARLYVATTQNTADEEVERRFKAYLDEIYTPTQAAQQVLKEKLLASGLEPDGFAIPLRNIRTEAAIFREANLPLQADEEKMSSDYAKIMSAQTVLWEGQETTVSQLKPVYQDPDRTRRELAWRLGAERQLADREKINKLWGRMLANRLEQARNAGFGEDYRAYRWQQFLRFDYTPEDCKQFHRAIEEVVVPAASRIYNRRKARLSVDALRPWDLEVDPLNRPPLRPFQTVDELVAKVSAIFHRVDPKLGSYFNAMVATGLTDLENRKNKAPGAYCHEFLVHREPFVFENAVGLHDDVQTLLHEGGHAMHVFETRALPNVLQLQVTMEFAEVASMGMELLASPYLAADLGGFYSQSDVARARVEHLESLILFWPYMATVDAFQHWVYENPRESTQASNCDAAWSGLWDRFMVGLDWEGFQAEKETGWHRKLHIHEIPFYYVEYGLAQLGAVQLWANALLNQKAAVGDYRRALALGGTATLPELFRTAGAKFSTDAATLGEAVGLIERTLQELDPD